MVMESLSYLHVVQISALREGTVLMRRGLARLLFVEMDVGTCGCSSFYSFKLICQYAAACACTQQWNACILQ